MRRWLCAIWVCAGDRPQLCRIHWQNLVNFGVLPFAFSDPADYDRVDEGDRLRIDGLKQLADRRQWTVENLTRKTEFAVSHDLSARQVKILLAGGLTNWVRESGRSKRQEGFASTGSA